METVAQVADPGGGAVPTNGDRPASSASGYNGWPTYETWLAHLWLTNDPATDTACRQLVAAAQTVGEAAEALKDLMEEESPLADQAGPYADLLTAALARVDWRAIAAHWHSPSGRAWSHAQ